MDKSTKKELDKLSNRIKVEREDPGSVDLREYRFIPKLKISKKKRPESYEKLFPGIG